MSPCKRSLVCTLVSLALVSGASRAEAGTACGGIGGKIRRASLFLPQKGGGADLSGIVAAPDPSLETGRCPGIALIPGGQRNTAGLEWEVDRLAASGYVALLARPDDGGDEEWNVAAKSAVDCLTSPGCNPFFDDTDTSTIGAAGYSLGSRTLTRTQEEDRRLAAIVAWDNMAISEAGDDGSPSCVNQPDIIREPRAAGMGQASEGCIGKDVDAKKTAYGRWRSFGVPSMEIVLSNCDHGCWTSTGTALQKDAIHYYSRTWFDRWLKNDPKATQRLLARQVGSVTIGSVLSTRYHSAAFLDGHDCPDLRSGCS